MENIVTRYHEENMSEEPLAPSWQWHKKGGTQAKEKWSRDLFQIGPRRTFVLDILQAIKQAKDMVIVCSFLLADKELIDALLEKAGQGVRVYILTEAAGRLESTPDDEDDFGKKVQKQHKEMLKQVESHVRLRSGSFHAKVLLVDPHSSAPKGILSTANFTKEALQRNEELGIRLNPSQCSALFEVLRYGFWEYAKEEQKKGAVISVSELGLLSIPRPDGGILYTIKRESPLRKAVLDLINQAERELIVSSFGWEDDHEVVRAIAAKAKEGVKVTILARYRVKTMPALCMLQEAGAQVYAYRWLHAKALVCDERGGIIMSANLEKHGMDEGFEIGVKLDDSQSHELARLLRHWAETAPCSKPVGATSRGERTGDLLVLNEDNNEDNKPWGEKKITDKFEMPLGEVTAETAENLDAPKPESANPIPENILPLKVCYQWAVVPPRLNKKARRVNGASENGGPEEYEHKGQKVIAIANQGQLEEAIALKEKVKAVAIVYR